MSRAKAMYEAALSKERGYEVHLSDEQWAKLNAQPAAGDMSRPSPDRAAAPAPAPQPAPPAAPKQKFVSGEFGYGPVEPTLESRVFPDAQYSPSEVFGDEMDANQSYAGSNVKKIAWRDQQWSAEQAAEAKRLEDEKFKQQAYADAKGIEAWEQANPSAPQPWAEPKPTYSYEAGMKPDHEYAPAISSIGTQKTWKIGGDSFGSAVAKKKSKKD